LIAPYLDRFFLGEGVFAMKPCDCKTYQDIGKLNESGMSFNNTSIGIDSAGVFLTINPHCRIKISHKFFKSFAEWYLEDQINNDR
jgi:hypothetical protein